MTMFLAPYTAIADIDGSPLDAGFMFFGEYEKDPELFPIEVFWDADFTVPAAQPIRTRNGYPVRNGSPTKVYLKTAQHSIVIKNRNSAFILVDFKNKGWDASFVVDGNKSQHEINQDQLAENEEIRLDIAKVESYIVYAEKYGSTLNEAMAAINTEFAGKRVRVYVPSDFPVTGTVDLNIDCDLDMKSLQVQTDVDTIFNPMVGWNGSTTPCDVFCNNKSVRLGWDLKKALGHVTLDKFRIFDVGNKVENTSAAWFCGFYISNKLIKRLDMYSPAVINSYVVPNGATGDAAGSNRAFIIEGYVSTGELVSDINIHDPYGENLLDDEDSDFIAISVGAASYDGLVLNIDIHNPVCINAQRRFLKVIGNDKVASGIRFHGDGRAIGSGVYPHTAIDVSKKAQVEWNGSFYASGWVQGFLIWDSAILKGNLSANLEMGNLNIISGTSVRGARVTAGGTLDIDALDVVGGFEALQVDETSTANIKDVNHTAYYQSASLNGKVKIEAYTYTISDPSGVALPITRAQQPILTASTSKVKIDAISAKCTTAVKPFACVQANAMTGLEINSIEATGFDFAAVRCTGAINTKVRRGVTDSQYMVYCETGGSNLLVDQCKAGTAGMVANGTANPLTNVIELNTLTF